MNAVLHCVPPPARQARDERLASEAAHDAAAVLTARWAAGTIGAGDAYDAELLGHLSTLDFVAEKLAEIEAAEAAGRRRSAVHAVGAPIASGGSRPIHGKRARRTWRPWLRGLVLRAQVHSAAKAFGVPERCSIDEGGEFAAEKLTRRRGM